MSRPGSSPRRDPLEKLLKGTGEDPATARSGLRYQRAASLSLPWTMATPQVSQLPGRNLQLLGARRGGGGLQSTPRCWKGPPASSSFPVGENIPEGDHPLLTSIQNILVSGRAGKPQSSGRELHWKGTKFRTKVNLPADLPVYLSLKSP